MKSLILLLYVVCFAVSLAQAQSLKLPEDYNKFLEKQFRSWKLYETESGIIEYYKRERNFEQPNLISGDWNGDGKAEYAVLLANKNDAEKRIIVVLMRVGDKHKFYVLEGSDCIMSIKKGKKDYDFEAKKSFRYKRDAIFSYFWEKGGSSYIFEKGKFRAIVTSD